MAPGNSRRRELLIARRLIERTHNSGIHRRLPEVVCLTYYRPKVVCLTYYVNYTEPVNTVDALVQLSFQIQRVLASVGAEYDLSIIQIRLLGILRDRQPGMLELGNHLGLDKSSITGLVSRAEKRGLVERTPSPHDGRGVLVALTPAGRRLAERGEADIARRITELTKRLNATQRKQFTQLASVVVHG